MYIETHICICGFKFIKKLYLYKDTHMNECDTHTYIYIRKKKLGKKRQRVNLITYKDLIFLQ